MSVKKYATEGQTFWCVDEWVIESGVRKRFRKWRIPSREAAEALQAKLRIESFEGRHFKRLKPVSLTFSQAWAHFCVHARGLKSWRAIRVYGERLVSVFSEKRCVDLTAADLERHRTWLLSRKHRHHGREVKPGTVDAEIIYAKAILRKCVADGLLTANPWDRVRTIGAPNTRSVNVGPAGVAVLMREAPDWFKPIIQMAYETGMRKSEILDLTWDRVDLSNGIIQLGVADTKTKAARNVMLTPGVAAHLAMRKRVGSLVFPSHRHPFGRMKNITEAWYELRAKAGYTSLNFHDLRRSFVTQARRAGIPEVVVMRLSGHRTRKVFDRYNIVEESDLREAVAMFPTVPGLSKNLRKAGGHA